MNDRRDLWAIAEALLIYAPFSLVSAFFGDSTWKDVPTPKQRVAPVLFSWTIGPMLGMVTVNDLSWPLFAGFVVAAVAHPPSPMMSSP